MPSLAPSCLALATLLSHVTAQRSYATAFNRWQQETGRRESAGTLYHAMPAAPSIRSRRRVVPGTSGGAAMEHFQASMPRARPNVTELEAHIMLIWNSRTDLDIHVVQPDGAEIYYGKPAGRRCFLLLDENAGPPFKDKPVEDFYIMRDSPAGDYVLSIHSFSIRNEPITALAVYITKHTTVHDLHGQLAGSFDSDPVGDHRTGLHNHERITIATITKSSSATGEVELSVKMHAKTSAGLGPPAASTPAAPAASSAPTANESPSHSLPIAAHHSISSENIGLGGTLYCIVTAVALLFCYCRKKRRPPVVLLKMDPVAVGLVADAAKPI